MVLEYTSSAFELSLYIVCLLVCMNIDKFYNIDARNTKFGMKLCNI